MALGRMDNHAVVVEDLDAAIAFFEELGLELEGRATVEGDPVDGLVDLRDTRSDIARSGPSRAGRLRSMQDS